MFTNLKFSLDELVTKLHSRKFLLAAAATLKFLADHNSGAALATIIAYLTAEGLIDLKRS